MSVCIEHHGLLILSRNPGRKLGIETHPVVELLEVDDGAVLALLERLVGARAVVVRHPPRAAPLLRVALLRAIPAACHANPRILVSHPTRPRRPPPRPGPAPRRGGGMEGGGRGPRGEYLRRRGAWARRRRRRTGRRGAACSCRRPDGSFSGGSNWVGREGFSFDSIRCGVSESACARIGWREREEPRRESRGAWPGIVARGSGWFGLVGDVKYGSTRASQK